MREVKRGPKPTNFHFAFTTVTTAVFSEVLLLSSREALSGLGHCVAKRRLALVETGKPFEINGKRTFSKAKKNKNKEKPVCLQRMTCPQGKR